MKKGAIFDLDGTLVNSMKVWENADYILAERYGFIPDEEYWNRVTSCSFMQGAEYITKRFKLRKTAEEIAQELYEIVLNDYKNSIKLKDGAKELLTRMKNDGLKLAIATSNTEEMTFAVLKSNGVFDLFTAFAYCDDVGKNKSYPDVYYKAASDMGILTEECYIFEDVPNAVEGAKKSGAEVIGVYDEYSAAKEQEIRTKSDRYIMSLKEFVY